MNFSKLTFLPPQLLGSQSHLCWVCRFAPIHQKRRYKSCCMLKYTTFTHLPNTFQHPQYVPFLVAELTDFSLTQSIILPSIHMLPCHAVFAYFYYHYISYYNVTFFLAKVLWLYNSIWYCYFFITLSCVSQHLAVALHFPAVM